MGTHAEAHQHTHTHTRTRTRASWNSLPKPMQLDRLLHTQSHRHSSSSLPPAPAWLPESQREMWIFFFFMSYSSEPIYFMVQLDGLLPGLLQKVHPPEQPQGGGRVVLPSQSPLAQESKCWARGWVEGACTRLQGSCWAFCLLQTGP